MNKDLLFLLVGVLFVASSVDAVHITVKDVESAIRTAWRLYVDLANGKLSPNDVHNSVWTVRLENGGTLSADCTIDSRRGLMNCGVPDSYLLPNTDFQALYDWFMYTKSTTFGGHGVVRDPVKKPNGIYKANAFYVKHPYSFNFHIPIDTNSKFSMLLKLLLARARLQ